MPFTKIRSVLVMPPFWNVLGIRLLYCLNQISISLQADSQNIRTTFCDKICYRSACICHSQFFFLIFSLYALSDFLYLATRAFVPVHAMEAYEEVRITPNVTNFDLGRCKWSEHCNAPFTPEGRLSGTQWIEDCMGLRGYVDFPLSITNKMQRYTIFFTTVNVLHVSGGFSSHYQEFKNYTYSIWCMSSLLAATAIGSSKQAWHIPDAVCTNRPKHVEHWQ